MINEECKIDHCSVCGQSMDTIIKNLFDTRFGLERLYCIGKCGNCRLEQTFPTPKLDELKNLYETYYNFGGGTGTAYSVLREKFLMSPLYRLWMLIDGDISFHNHKGRGRLLDLGCNEGRGLKIYYHNGFISEGLELNETAAAVARAQGFTVYTGLIENFHPNESYDVVVLSNVLEHSLHPRDLLSQVRRILKPGGQVWISCPNRKSWLRSLFGSYWINWHVPFHIVHFSSQSLRKMLEETEFDVTKVRFETPSLWVAHSIIARLFAKRGKPTRALRNLLLVLLLILFIRGFLFPLLWIENRLGRGDCLVVIAQKR